MNDKQIDERNELFDSAVREQLTGYEPQVPHALWNRISSELDNGQASDELETVIPQHHQKTMLSKWKFAAAAAVLLTLTIGTLLYTLNSSNATNITSTPIANTAHATTVSLPAATVPVQVTETKMVAQSFPVIKKAVSTQTGAQKVVSQPVIAATVIETAIENVPAKQDLTAQEIQMEFTPIQSENKPVEVGNIPLASLNFLSTPSALNDEITVIKSAEKKRKHGKKGDDESTKVILIGKKFDSRPDIRYQVPVRF